MKTLVRDIFPWCVVLVAGVYLAMMARPARDDGAYQLQLLGRVPVSADGRVKPLDTVARNSLMILSGKQTLRIDGQRQPAIRWLADVLARPEQSDQYEVFRVDHPDVLSLMGLTHEDGKRFSFKRIIQHGEVISKEARIAHETKVGDRQSYQRAVLDLYNHVGLYVALREMRRPYWVAPLQADEDWQRFDEVLGESMQAQQPHPVVLSVFSFLQAYQQDQPAAFNRAVSRYLVRLDQYLPTQTGRADYEVFFNLFAPFYHATVFYVIAFLLAFGSFLLWCRSDTEALDATAGSSPGTGSRVTGSPGASELGMTWSRALGRSAVWLLALTLLLHTFGIVSRMVLQGRPPVTNLYSSAVFIGWVGVAIMLLMEWIYRVGLGSITAAVIGFATCIIAHHLAGDGDTMEMMQAVLDSNFWLSTHVVTITVGYAATFLAGALAIAFILLGVFTRVLNRELIKTLGKMVYGIVCFAALFSFVGTVLGGIWADQSWGRFWGWDPKENGAVLIVLMNVLILHARWGGMIRERGMMVLAVGGNIVTSWSWFGTNMLGVGLHSYGFMDSAVFWLLVFVASQLFVMGLGLLPVTMWRSFVHASDATRRGEGPSRRSRLPGEAGPSVQAKTVLDAGR